MTLPNAEPLFFGPTERPCFGWIHRAARDDSAVGVVLCNPFGYEAICAHRSIRRFAASFAAAGITALRFDYDGTGDSAGDDRDPDRLESWVASTRHAVATLRREGVERVFLFGIRFGALVAALAAQELDDIAGIVAVAPVVRGKAYARELHLLHKALALAEQPGTTPSDQPADEAHGFVLTPETRAAFGRVDLTKLTRSPGREVLILDREDLPAAEPWEKHLVAQGVSVEASRVKGYVEMMLDPHKSSVPMEMVRQATEWLAKRANASAPTSSRRETRGASAPSSATFGDAVERPVFLSAGPARIFGILTTPLASAKTSGRAILLLNAGAIHHVGPNRLYVPFARRWAAEGDQVLRLDITGLGESPARSGREEHVVYSHEAVEDIGAAIQWFRRQPTVREVWMIGLCSGAYHALKAALKHTIDGYIAINPLTFHIDPGTPPIDFVPAARIARDAARYQEAIWDPERWKKVFRGEVDVRGVARTVRRRVSERLVDRARNLSRRLHMPWKNDVAAELEQLAASGVTQRFIFADGDPGHQLLHEKAGSVVPGLLARGKVVIDMIDGPDHTFTQLWSHAPLLMMLTRALVRSK